VGVANVLLGGLLWQASERFDWIALQTQWAWRAGLLAGVMLTAAVLYFGALRLMGLNVRQFARRG
jgi:putative peptidoglycan lipid II flippase